MILTFYFKLVFFFFLVRPASIVNEKNFILNYKDGFKKLMDIYYSRLDYNLEYFCINMNNFHKISIKVEGLLCTLWRCCLLCKHPFRPNSHHVNKGCKNIIYDESPFPS